MGIRLELGIDKKNREGDREELERGGGNVQTLFNDVLQFVTRQLYDPLTPTHAYAHWAYTKGPKRVGPRYTSHWYRRA